MNQREAGTREGENLNDVEEAKSPEGRGWRDCPFSGLESEDRGCESGLNPLQITITIDFQMF